MREAIPPYDADAEESVIGSILIDSEAIYAVNSFLKVEDFFNEPNQFIYDAMMKISESGGAINQVTVASSLAGTGKLDEAGGAAYLSHCISETPTSLHVEHYARIVFNLAVRRRLISAASQIENIAYTESDPHQCVTKIDQLLLKSYSRLALPRIITPDELAELAVTRYTNLRNKEHPVAISTGWPELDEATGGMFPGESWILAARTGIGKSQIAIQIAQCAGNFGSVAIFPLEMDYESILDRIISQTIPPTNYPSKISQLQRIRSGAFGDDTFQNIMDAIPSIAESNLYLFSLRNDMITVPPVTINYILSTAQHVKMAYGLSLIVIDYLGLLDAPPEDIRKTRTDQVSAMSKGIKTMARILDVPILTLVQINREPERRTDHRPQSSDLRDSGSIEQDADVLLLAYRDSAYDEICDNPEEAEVRIAKQRQGGSNITLKLHWEKQRGKYSEIKFY